MITGFPKQSPPAHRSPPLTSRITTPSSAVLVDTYEAFDRFIGAFVAGHLNLIIVIGRAGVAKSQSVRKAVGADACWLESNATAYGIYGELYRNRDRLVVIDDVDSLYADRAAVRLLKCLCQTDPVKSVAWHTAAVGKPGEGGVPNRFETRSRVCIIANDWKTLSANTAAVEDRGHVLHFDPTPEAVHTRVAEWFWDQEVHDWFGQFLHMIPDLSMRQYVRAAELKAAGIDWVSAILRDDIAPKVRLIAELKADDTFPEERDRVAAFESRGGGGKTTWYKWMKKIKPPGEVVGRIPLRCVRNGVFKAA